MAANTTGSASSTAPVTSSSTSTCGEVAIEQRIVGDGGPARLDGTGECCSAAAVDRVGLAGGIIDPHGLVRRAVGDRHHPHGRGVDGVDLQDHAGRHEARPDHPDLGSAAGPRRRAAPGHYRR
jgi:hypothetical protein